jgi:hypothetical protein
MRRTLLGVLLALSFAGCLVSPALYFLGLLSQGGFKLILLGASVAWFVFATLWAGARRP